MSASLGLKPMFVAALGAAFSRALPRTVFS
jgi:hypothetical protein